MHAFFYSSYIFFSIRDSHIGDIKLKNTFYTFTQIPAVTTSNRVKNPAIECKKTLHPYMKISEAYTRNCRVQKKNKAHTYKLHAVRKGCTQSHKILTHDHHTHTNSCYTQTRMTSTESYTHTYTPKKTIYVLWKCFSLQQLKRVSQRKPRGKDIQTFSRLKKN